MKQPFLPADILLPKGGFEKWAVIACDQYTSEPQYWKSAADYVGDAPSALNLVFPEVYLSDDNSKKISEINANMKKYIKNGVFNEFKNTFIYIKRTVTGGKIRRGVTGLIDLCDYSYEKGSKTLIRATEETVPERIPPRVEIRKDAPLELPHIMLLIDDPDMTVIAPLDKKTEGKKPLYDFDLMLNGGHITGTALSEKDAAELQDALGALVENSEDKLLFAVGDGNHSLAAAKECYRVNKSEKSRYALVEIVNIHDESLEFEPIYRVIFGADPEKVIHDFTEFSGGDHNGADAQDFTCFYGGCERKISVKPSSKLCVGTLQRFIDRYIKDNPSLKADYIHGEDSLRLLAEKPDTVGFIFDGMKKKRIVRCC